MSTGLNHKHNKFKIILLPDQEPIRLNMTFPSTNMFSDKLMWLIFIVNFSIGF